MTLWRGRKGAKRPYGESSGRTFHETPMKRRRRRLRRKKAEPTPVSRRDIDAVARYQRVSLPWNTFCILFTIVAAKPLVSVLVRPGWIRFRVGQGRRTGSTSENR